MRGTAMSRLLAGLAAGTTLSCPTFAQQVAEGEDPVVRGEYLAQLGGCKHCHTEEDGAGPYAGGVVLDTPFGTLVGPNITPDPETGIGEWTADIYLLSALQRITEV